MQKNERLNEILLILNSCQYVTVEFLSRELHISASSIRRDLALLENRGLVKRSYGGVELMTSGNRVIPFSMRSHENPLEKKRIARRAASLVNEGDVLYLDGSTSSYYMIDYLAAIKNITVATNSIDSICQLAQYDIRAFCTGGHVSRENKAVLTGGFAEHLIGNLHADYAFFSAQAIGTDGNIYDCYESEVPLRKSMLKNAGKRVLLSDGSKFNNTSVFLIENICHIDYVITDIPLDREFTDKFPNAQFVIA